MKRKNYFSVAMKLCFLSVCASLLPSCARQISSDVYASGHVGEASTTYSGFIASVREVRMEEGERLEENGMGIVGGGVAGGVLGNAIGRGNAFPTVAGALAGAVAGSLIEKKAKQQSALEYVVRLENGGLLTIVQATDHLFNVGEPVYVIIGASGRSRIVGR